MDQTLSTKLLLVSKKNKKFKRFFRNKSSGAVLAERSKRTIRDIFERPVSERRKADWIVILPTITKRYNNIIQSSTTLSSNQECLKKNEGCVCRNLIEEKERK